LPTSASASNRPGPKPTLTQATVIEAALDLVDEHGLGGLNLRKLAARLGVSAMTPYGYFEDKTQLLGEMLGYALVALSLDQSSADPWDRQLERAMLGMHDALEKHPGVIELIMAEAGSDAGRLEEFRRAMITLLTRGGMTREQSITSLRTLTSYVLGYTMLTRLRRGSGPRRPAGPASFEHGLTQLLDAIRAEAARS
jgi:AcrR family transcriptional regulator